jgi:hypothetical protein
MPGNRIQRAEREVEQALRAVPAGVAAQVLEEAEDKVEQRAIDEKNTKPGQVVNGFKRAWTMKECEAAFPVKVFMPEETVPLTWNGLRVQAIAGVQMAVPECFYDIYVKHREALRKKPELPDRGMSNIVMLNAGPLES